MIVNYSSVEMTGSYSPNMQQNIESMLGIRIKKIAVDDFSNIFPYFFLSFWQCLFFWQNKEMIISLLSAEYSQREVMVKDKPYLCMCEKWV